jgi:hypothetical protein
MNRLACVVLTIALALSSAGAQSQKKRLRRTAAPGKPVAAKNAETSSLPDAAKLDQMAARFAPTWFRVEIGKLSPADREALPKLIEAARILNGVFMDQYWSGDRALYRELQKDTTAFGRARAHYF